MVLELGGSVFEFTHDLVGDLFRAKNAGVTVTKRRDLRPAQPTVRQRGGTSKERNNCRKDNRS
jgi:hypothetical protein